MLTKTAAYTTWILVGLSAGLSALFAQPPMGPAVPPATYAAADHNPQVPVFVTRQTTFSIPFSVAAGTRNPVEVHLYVSRDAGRTWRLYARQTPGARRFTFTAEGDGDYWFASRTIAASQAAGTQYSLHAEMQIIVDTVEPECEFNVRAGQQGAVIANWHIYDPHLDKNSLRIEYRSRVTEPWTPVSVAPPTNASPQDRLDGQTSWSLKTPAPTVDVRAEVCDRAGNRTVVNRRLLLPALAESSPASPPSRNPLPPNTTPLGQPSAPYAGITGPGVAPVPWPSQGAERLDIRNSQPAYASAGSIEPPRSVAFDNHATPPALPTDGTAIQSTASPARLPQIAGPGRVSANTASTMDTSRAATTAAYPRTTADQSRKDELVSVVEIGKSSKSTASSMAATDLDRVSPLVKSDEALASPNVGGPVIAPASIERGGLLSSNGQLPPGEHAQMTNSRRFQLGYDIDAVGPSGVAEVQLWATEDGGSTWRLWGTDNDLQSPFDVEVEREGIFGFRIVIVSRNGLAGPRPRNGEPADIWVGVDTTPPVAHLISATYGEGTRAGNLIIHWQAEDANLGRRPVTLLFSENSGGPWTIIASGLSNKGEYAWPADPQLPPLVYLRLEVRDEAGNVGADQTDEPIRIDGLAPKARIRGLMRSPAVDREAYHQPQRR